MEQPLQYIIETPRLHLRIILPEDAYQIFHGYAQQEAAARFLPWETHTDIAETHAFVADVLSKQDPERKLTFALIKRDTTQFLGLIELRLEAPWAEIGYVLDKNYWGNGYMAEAAQAVSEHALRRENIFRVQALISPQNRGSVRVAEKAGFTREGILRKYQIVPKISGTPLDMAVYAKVKTA